MGEHIAAAYLRLSRDDVRQTSIPRQRELCITATKQHDYDTPLVFVDEGISGLILERPDLERMLAAVRSGQIQAVFVIDGDRLSREPAHDWLIRQELKNYQVSLYINGALTDNSPEGELQSSVLAIFAKFEARKINQRIIAGKNFRARNASTR